MTHFEQGLNTIALSIFSASLIGCIVSTVVLLVTG